MDVQLGRWKSDNAALHAEIESLRRKLREAASERKEVKPEGTTPLAEREFGAEMEFLDPRQMMGQNDQFVKFMEHSDELRAKHLELREKHAECHGEVRRLRQELSERERAHSRAAVEWRGRLETLEGERADANRNVARLTAELARARETASNREKDLERIVREKDDGMAMLRGDLTSCVAERTNAVECLDETIRTPERALERSRQECQNVTGTLGRMKKELVRLREGKRRQEDDLRQIVDEKETTLLTLRGDFAQYVADKTDATEGRKWQHRSTRARS